MANNETTSHWGSHWESHTVRDSLNSSGIQPLSFSIWTDINLLLLSRRMPGVTRRLTHLGRKIGALAEPAAIQLWGICRENQLRVPEGSESWTEAGQFGSLLKLFESEKRESKEWNNRKLRFHWNVLKVSIWNTSCSPVEQRQSHWEYRIQFKEPNPIGRSRRSALQFSIRTLQFSSPLATPHFGHSSFLLNKLFKFRLKYYGCQNSSTSGRQSLESRVSISIIMNSLQVLFWRFFDDVLAIGGDSNRPHSHSVWHSVWPH